MTNCTRVVLVVHLNVNESCLDDYVQLITQHAQNSLRLEPGCLQFDVLFPEENSNQLILVESYEDAAALEMHKNSAHMSDYRKRTEGMVSKSKIYYCTSTAEYR
ncbi:MAG: hypothetical protein CL398_12920 [Acidiferrobacteraceae bacterium]|nr:hypothetical protein [Acidiferrobacteraceae bacterium]